MRCNLRRCRRSSLGWPDPLNLSFRHCLLGGRLPGHLDRALRGFWRSRAGRLADRPSFGDRLLGNLLGRLSWSGFSFTQPEDGVIVATALVALLPVTGLVGPGEPTKLGALVRVQGVAHTGAFGRDLCGKALTTGCWCSLSSLGRRLLGRQRLERVGPGVVLLVRLPRLTAQS